LLGPCGGQGESDKCCKCLLLSQKMQEELKLHATI